MENNVVKLNESQLHDLIKESVKKVLREMDEVSEKGIMPGKFLSLFKNRIINAAHGKIGDVEREVNEFYRYYSRIIQNPKFTIENLMELAEKIEYGESSHGNPGMNRQNFANGWWGGNWGKNLEENKKIKKVFNMEKNVVKLNESQLHDLIKESVKMVLREMAGTDEISSDMISRASKKFYQKYGGTFSPGPDAKDFPKDEHGNLLYPKDMKPLATHYKNFNKAYNSRKKEEMFENPLIAKAQQIYDDNYGELEVDYGEFVDDYCREINLWMKVEDEGGVWTFEGFGQICGDDKDVTEMHFTSPDGQEGEIPNP